MYTSQTKLLALGVPSSRRGLAPSKRKSFLPLGSLLDPKWGPFVDPLGDPWGIGPGRFDPTYIILSI